MKTDGKSDIRKQIEQYKDIASNFHIADDLNIFKAGDEDFAFVGQRGLFCKKSDG